MTDGIEVEMGQVRSSPLYLVHCMTEWDVKWIIMAYMIYNLQSFGPKINDLFFFRVKKRAIVYLFLKHFFYDRLYGEI